MKNSYLSKILIALYVLIVLGFSAAARANTDKTLFEVKNVDTAMHLTGELVVTLEGRPYLIMADNKYFALIAESDLTDLNGVQVEVIGFEPKHKVGPVVELMSMDPLLDDVSAPRFDPVFVVLKVRELSK